MADEAINAFEVFSSLEKGHENHLTRALLVLLRHSPLAHQVWLRAIGLSDLGWARVAEAHYRFQTSSLDLPALQPDQPLRGVSVFISCEEAENLGPIAASEDQKMIPDALIVYPGSPEPIVVVVESKVHAAADALQARRINLGPQAPQWDPSVPVAIRWSKLIDDLWALTDLDIGGGAEATLLSDFFDFVDTHYRRVGPYSTLRRCGDIEERILRRCRAVLAAATDREAIGPRRGRGPYVEMEGPASLPRRVAFDLADDGSYLRLSFWPADTPTQARAFYSNPELPKRVIAMTEAGKWTVTANMHFGHFQAGYSWLPMPSETPIGHYLDFWGANVESIGTFYEPPKQPDWNDLLEKLEKAKIIASREAFDRDFVQTNRTKADVRPGIELSRLWDFDEAVELDDRGDLVNDVREAFNHALETFEV
jgi:hypothetical protein